MNINQFKQFEGNFHTVSKQTNTRHLSWMKQVGSRVQSEIITPMGANVPPLLGVAFSQFMAAENHEDDCYLIIVKSEWTSQIGELDRQRDTKYVGLKSMADAMSRIGSAEQQQYAEQLIDLVAHYKVDISERYDDETTKMDQLLQQLLTETWAPRIAALGLTETVAELSSINQEMKRLIDLRNNDLSTLTPQAMVQARAASDEAYALLVSVINAFAIVQWADGSSPYDQAIARLNQDMVHYMRNVFNVKPSSSSSSSSSQQGGSSSEQGGTEQGGSSSEEGGQQGGGLPPSGGGEVGDDNGGSSENGGGDNGGGLPPSGGGEAGDNSGGGGGAVLPGSGGEG